MKYGLILTFVFLSACSHLKERKARPAPTTQDTLAYQKPQILSINGDFDGDGVQDKLIEFISDSTGRQADRIIDFKSYEIQEVQKYFDEHHLHVQLNMNNKNTGIDTSISCGLYCLINVGDLNKDKRDEIALVPDLMDFSRHNYCRIYSLCPTAWKELFNFNVHEGAFDFEGDTSPVFGNIPEALEYRNTEWRFYDYLDMDYETLEQVGQMKKLVVGKCTK